jgi:hypothetical protein
MTDATERATDSADTGLLAQLDAVKKRLEQGQILMQGHRLLRDLLWCLDPEQARELVNDLWVAIEAHRRGDPEPWPTSISTCCAACGSASSSASCAIATAMSCPTTMLAAMTLSCCCG